MKSILKYYYNLDINNIKKSDNEYSFYIDKNNYMFVLVERSIEEINELYLLAQELNLMGLPCDSILLNQYEKVITYYNNKPYILLKKNVISNEVITINDIVNFNTFTTFNWHYEKINRTNWKQLWSRKMDYFEYQLSQVGGKNKVLCQMFDYYEGFVEVGIQLLDIYNTEYANVCICHKRINKKTTISEFYNPLNFIIDYKIRDTAEYFKQKLINDDDADIEIIYYLENMVDNNYDKLYFLIRLFFPSFYFDIYENILVEKEKIKSLDSILLNHKKYEKNLKKIYDYISSYINLPMIEWLTNL